jgi:hypothetical protein
MNFLYKLSIVLIYSFSIAVSQAPDTLWTRTFGGLGQDSCWSAQYTADNGFILAGWTNSYGAGNRDFYIVKTDSSGDTMWTRTFGGADVDECLSITQTFDDGYLAGGRTWSFGPEGDVWLIKLNAQGDSQWTKTIGGLGWETCRSLQQTADSGFIIIGSTNSFGAGNDDIYVIKVNKNGDTLWTRTYGGPLNDNGYAVSQTNNGEYILACWTESYGVGSYDAYIIKTDSLGDSIWTRVWGGSNMDKACAIMIADDGSYMIAGWTFSFGPNAQNAYLLKMTPSGDSVWTKYYGDDIFSDFYSVQKTMDRGYILAGGTGSSNPTADMYLVKTDSMGDMLWYTRYGGSGQDYGWAAEQTDDGGYYIAGWTGSFGAGGADFYLVKTGPEQGVNENAIMPVQQKNIPATVISGAVILPRDKKCRIFDIAGRAVQQSNLSPGIFFVEIDGKITSKIIKVR